MLRRRALYATVWGIRRLRSGAKTPLTFVAVRKNRQNRRAASLRAPPGMRGETETAMTPASAGGAGASAVSCRRCGIFIFRSTCRRDVAPADSSPGRGNGDGRGSRAKRSSSRHARRRHLRSRARSRLRRFGFRTLDTSDTSDTSDSMDSSDAQTFRAHRAPPARVRRRLACFRPARRWNRFRVAIGIAGLRTVFPAFAPIPTLIARTK